MNIHDYNIFYTDDDQDDQNFFKVAGNQVSPALKITTFGDGDELISQLKNRPSYPDIIFLDLNMPGKTGLEVLKEIKQSSTNINLTIIIFSTSDDAESIASSRQLGARMYIPKPSSISSLKKVIKYAISINWKTFNSDGEDFVFRVN